MYKCEFYIFQDFKCLIVIFIYLLTQPHAFNKQLLLYNESLYRPTRDNSASPDHRPRHSLIF